MIMIKQCEKKAWEFPALPYTYDALEPFIDAQTMEIHYTKHHRAYFDKFYAAIKGTEFENMCMLHILDMVSELSVAIRNNAGGFYNHKFFWKVIGPDCGGYPTGKLADAINFTFRSFENFQKVFTDAATSRFGSGWAWLIVRHDGTLAVTSTPNQDNPLMDVADQRGFPILALDVWEHAYYLKYQNRRMDYIKAFWNIVNWEKVSSGYLKAIE
jgi:Fe-Mn family superoxide dismutase